VVSAMEAVEELRVQDPSNSNEWQGWKLEIVDASGQAVHAIPLDASLVGGLLSENWLLS